MKYLCSAALVLAFAALHGPTARAADEADYRDKLESLVTDGSIEALEIGDLNGNKIDDAVVAVKPEESASPPADADEEFVRGSLRIYFFDAKGEPHLRLKIPKSICFLCGGITGGDFPFTLKIERGVLTLTFFGGSREAYSTATKWRIQNGDFALIGIVDDQTDTIADVGKLRSVHREANISTLQMTETRETVASKTEDGEVKTKKESTNCAVPTSFKVMSIRKYVGDKFKVPQCTPAAIE